MATTTTEAAVIPHARAIAEGLIRTKRAGHHGVLDQGMLRLECKKGGYYWISFVGSRILRGKTFFEAEELQPKFIDAMERVGH